jgi:hypothetical protein
MNTTYEVQYWSDASDRWVTCGETEYGCYDDALFTFRTQAEDDNLVHRLVAITTDVVAMGFKESEVVR